MKQYFRVSQLKFIIPIALWALGTVAFYAVPTNFVCPVHHTRLRNDLLLIQYGKVRQERNFRQYRQAKQQFPESNAVAFGGCLWEPLDFVRPVVYCEQCRKAEEEWQRQHGNPVHL